MRACAIALLLAAGVPAGAAPDPRNRYRIDAIVSPDLETIEGELRARVVNDTAAPVDALTLWLYPNVFARTPAGVTPVNRDFYQPTGPGRGGIEVHELRVADVPRTPVPIEAPPAPRGTARLVPLAAPLPPGEATTVALHFRTRVPRRLGPLSTDRRSLTALGGWHPYLTAGDARERAAPRRPPDARFEVAVQAPAGFHVRPGADALGGFTGPFVPLWIRPPGVRPIRTAAGRVWPLVPKPEAGPGCGLPDPAPVPGEWSAADLAELAGRLDAWADGAGLPDPGPLDLFVVPLGSELALASGGGVAVSDRFYAVPPLAAVRRLHDRAVARAVLAERLLPWVRAREAPADVPQVADALGAHYAARFVAETAGRTADVAGLLSLLDFVPSLDAFLRSPKSAFPHVYFLPITEPMPVRDEPWTFNVPAPRGNLALEKTIDRVGEPAVAAAIARYLDPGSTDSFVAALEAVTGQEVGPFWAAWTERPYREDLRVRRLGEVEGTGGVRTRIELSRAGDAPPETIEAAVSDGAGGYQTLVWRAEEGERSRVFEVRTPEPVDRVRVDPRGRVTQAAIDRAEVPALGDVDPPRLQLLVTRLGLAYSVPDRSPYGDLGVLLRRRDDVRRRLGLGAAYRPARTGLRAYVGHGFGPLVDAARHAYGATLGLDGDYLRRGFGGQDTESGWALGPTFGIGFDDRPPIPSADRGNAWMAGTSLRIGRSGQGGPSYYGGLEAGGIHLEPLGRGHSLALRLRGNLIAGDPPVQDLLPLGGTDEGLRGFTLEEVLGERLAVAGAEWRLPLLRGLRENLLLGHLRGIGAAAFVEGAFLDGIHHADGLPPGTERAFFGDVGAGLRLHAEFLGVQELLFSVDAAVPLGRREPVDRPPVTVLLRAGQPFSAP